MLCFGGGVGDMCLVEVLGTMLWEIRISIEYSYNDQFYFFNLRSLGSETVKLFASDGTDFLVPVMVHNFNRP